MCAWIVHMYEMSTIAGSTMEQYVSVVNRAYETSGLDRPGKPVNGNKLYVEVRKSIDGFKCVREKHGAAGPVPTLPTPDYVIGALFAFVRRMLTPPISVLSFEMALSGLANVWQYLNISRPTMTAAMKWKVVTSVSAREVDFILPRLAPGRKNRHAPTRRFLRRIVSSEPEPDLHPISLFFDYHQAILCLAERRQLPEPTFVWQLPTERFKLELMNSNLMVKWLKQAAKKATFALPEGLTSRCDRSGAATVTKKLVVETASLCQLADWDEDGILVRKRYW
jgi:hypothetical protein